MDIPVIMNKALCEEDFQINTKQQVISIQKNFYLRMAYFNILGTDLNQPISFKVCCEKVIQETSEVGHQNDIKPPDYKEVASKK